MFSAKRTPRRPTPANNAHQQQQTETFTRPNSMLKLYNSSQKSRELFTLYSYDSHSLPLQLQQQTLEKNKYKVLLRTIQPTNSIDIIVLITKNRIQIWNPMRESVCTIVNKWQSLDASVYIIDDVIKIVHETMIYTIKGKEIELEEDYHRLGGRILTLYKNYIFYEREGNICYIVEGSVEMPVKKVEFGNFRKIFVTKAMDSDIETEEIVVLVTKTFVQLFELKTRKSLKIIYLADILDCFLTKDNIFVLTKTQLKVYSRKTFQPSKSDEYEQRFNVNNFSSMEYFGIVVVDGVLSLLGRNGVLFDMIEYVPIQLHHQQNYDYTLDHSDCLGLLLMDPNTKSIQVYKFTPSASDRSNDAVNLIRMKQFVYSNYSDNVDLKQGYGIDQQQQQQQQLVQELIREVLNQKINSSSGDNEGVESLSRRIRLLRNLRILTKQGSDKLKVEYELIKQEYLLKFIEDGRIAMINAGGEWIEMEDFEQVLSMLNQLDQQQLPLDQEDEEMIKAMLLDYGKELIQRVGYCSNEYLMILLTEVTTSIPQTLKGKEMYLELCRVLLKLSTENEEVKSRAVEEIEKKLQPEIVYEVCVENGMIEEASRIAYERGDLMIKRSRRDFGEEILESIFEKYLQEGDKDKNKNAGGGSSRKIKEMIRVVKENGYEEELLKYLKNKNNELYFIVLMELRRYREALTVLESRQIQLESLVEEEGVGIKAEASLRNLLQIHLMD